MATFVNNRENQRIINSRLKPSSNSLLHNRLNNLNFNGLNLEAQNVVIPPIAVNPSTSVIKVFVYETVVSPDQIFFGQIPPYPKVFMKPYSFKKLTKKNNRNNLPIISKEASIANSRLNTTLYTKNIIRNTNNENIGIVLPVDLELLYQEYYTYSARKELGSFVNTNGLFPQLKAQIYSHFDNLFTLSTQIMQNYYNTNGFNHTILQNNDEIIIKLNEATDSKIIIMGDQHGSFHSFFRLLIRLMIEGVIDNNYRLIENYKIIFLGDIVDRGYFSIEIMYIILRLFIANNTEQELKIIINRGNHEVESQFMVNGFGNEIRRKFPNSIAKIRGFVNFFKYCPSATILKHNDMKYWLCHGGFLVNNIINFNSNDNIYLNRAMPYNDSQIRWNDFSNKSGDGAGRANGCFSIGTTSLRQFLNTYNINFIIRGHTDSDSNAMILSDSSLNSVQSVPHRMFNEHDFLDINLISNRDLLQATSAANLITYMPATPKAENEIAIINTRLFECGSQLLYPVLTISNNSDLLRPLYNDSYVVIESVTQNGGKVKKINSKSNKLINNFKKSDLVKIAKKYNISLKTKDGAVKSKEQLFKSLKRKKLI